MRQIIAQVIVALCIITTIATIGYVLLTGFPSLRWLLNANLDSAWAALIGAIIGAGGTVIATRFETASEKERAIEQRMFEARRDAYESAHRLFYFLFTQRQAGKVVGPDNKEAQENSGIDAIGRLTLFASNDLTDGIYELMQLFDAEIPRDNQHKKQDIESIKKKRNMVSRLMRQDLGLRD